MKTCYLDFDRTILESVFPNTDIHFLNENCIEFVKRVKELGYKLVLNTYRADLKNGSLEQALHSVESYIEFDGILANKIPPQPFDLNTDTLYIDDESKGIPLKLSNKVLGLKVVDFSRIIALLDLKHSEINIGGQIWTNKNWNTRIFNNSESILIAKSRGDWYDAIIKQQPAICISPDYPDEVLYNWYAINDERGIVPEGYRIPNFSDVHKLIDYLGGPKYAGVQLKATDWEECSYIEIDQLERIKKIGNFTGFSAVPIGLRRRDGWYQGRMFGSFFWVINDDSPAKPTVFKLIEGIEAAILENTEQFESHRDFPITQYAFSIRLIKNT
ncbi:fibrobacter succinogenes major paralogous domain-containing protein [Flavobacterium aciduliphilum]|nr:fibrobacter succinogenes major paralogous domain-containing protein [Flavobacterium aciduliphilum]